MLLVRSDGSLQRFINKEARAGTVKAQAGASNRTIAHAVAKASENAREAGTFSGARQFESLGDMRRCLYEAADTGDLESRFNEVIAAFREVFGDPDKQRNNWQALKRTVGDRRRELTLDKSAALYEAYDVLEVIHTSKGPVEVIHYRHANNNKRPTMPGRGNAIYATRHVDGTVNNVYSTNDDGIVLEEWNCGTHPHYIDEKYERWHKYIGTNPDHRLSRKEVMKPDEIEFVKGIGVS